MAKAKTKHARKKEKAPQQRAEVNPFRAQHGGTVSAGMAVKIIPAIDTLKTKGHITQGEYDALKYYREQASLAEQSPTRDSCDFSVRGGEGHGPSVAIISAKVETERLEKLMGGLFPIARAICVDDLSLEQWMKEKYGTVGAGKRGRPRKDELKPNCSPDQAMFVRWELKMAANRMANKK